MKAVIMSHWVHGLIGLAILVWTNVTSAAPPINVVNFEGGFFIPDPVGLTYQKNNFCIFSGEENSNFLSPVALPNGSVINQIELVYYDNNTTNNSALYLAKTSFSGGTRSFSIIKSIVENEAVSTSYRSIKSDIFSEVVDNSANFYKLIWATSATNNLALCGARIYYSPPVNASYLPQIMK